MQRRRRGPALPLRGLRPHLFWALLLGLPVLAQQAAQAPALELSPPTAVEREVAQQLVQLSSRMHYGKVVLDDALSARLLERYLDTLDPSRAFLLASDVAEFQGLRTELDDDLRKGAVEPAYRIFERFQERRLARLADQVTAVERDLPGLRFDGDETLELDRTKLPWPASEAELDALWRGLLTNDVLELRLAGRSEAEQREILTRRYRSQLERAQRIRGTDVFELFLNAYTSLLDPHSEYFAPRQAQDFDISMSLSLQGIGALIGSDGTYPRVDQIIPGGPADRGGELRATDRITGVAQGDEGEMVDVRGWRTDEVVQLIRGKKDTIVRLEILPGDGPESAATHVVRLVRDEVRLEDQAAKSRVITVSREGRDYAVGVIELPAFYLDFKAYNAKDPDYRSATRDVARLVQELAAQHVDGLVVDLRDNGGGSLLEAQDLAGLFLGRGPVVQIRNAAGQVEVLRGDQPALYQGPLAVLVNRLSASASEIFAAAVQDRGRGPILGGRTFGKGTVQQVVPLEEGQLKLTEAKFYRVSGGSTQHRGVLPDVPLPETYDDDVIGESALDDALPWDSIEAAQPAPPAGLAALSSELLRRHEARTATDPDFRRAAELLAFQEEQRKQTRISLNEAVRRQQRDDLEARRRAIDARWRAARGEAPATTDAAEEEAAAEREAARRMLDPHKKEADAYQREACEVLVDLIASGATRAPGPPWIAGAGGR